MSTYTVSNRAYIKIFFHAAKHPQRSVNGVLLGKAEASGVVIEDAVPLLHHWTSLSPMMEIGLDLVSNISRIRFTFTCTKEGGAICRLSRVEIGWLLPSMRMAGRRRVGPCG